MSNTHPVRQVAQTLHSLLSSDVAVQAVLGTPARLYDNPPEDPVFPYLTYGPMRSSDIGGDEADIQTHTLTLHLWSRYGGRAEVIDAISAVTSALGKSQSNNDNDIHIVRSQVLYTDIFRDPDGQTLHGLIRFLLTTDQTPET